MTGDTGQTSGPPAPSGPQKGAGRRAGYGGPLLLSVLAALAFGQAILLYPLLFGPRRYEAERESDVNLPGRRIRVLVSRGDPQLILKTTLDDPAANRRDEEMLDRYLFPGGPRHRYYLLCVTRGEAEAAAPDLSAARLMLEDDSGRSYAPADLALALEAGRERLPAWLLATLSRSVPGTDGVAPGGRLSTVLLAYPEAAVLDVLRRARLGDRELAPAEYTKDEVDRALETAGPLPSARAP